MAKKTAAISSPLNKSQILADIATTTGLAKRDVGKVVEELASVIERHIGKKAKPARTGIKIRPLKTLKDMV